MKIGLLEDNPAILDYMTTALQMAGHSVETHTQTSSLLAALVAGEGQNATNSLPYDLVIIDLLLPGDIYGVSAIQHIQQVTSPEILPIIIVSACSQDELEQVKEKLPHIPIIRKPFKMGMLLRLIEEMKI